MFDDPLQFYSRAVSAGIVIAVLVCLGAALLAYFKPLGKRGSDTLLVDRTTNQLYVMIPGTGQLRPVYNLTSARLVLGNAGTPVAVKSDELNRMPKGQPIGIPGAPYATPVGGAQFDVDVVRHRDQARERRAQRGDVGDRATVAARRLGRSDAPRRGRAGELREQQLAGHRRPAGTTSTSSDRALTSAVGIPVTAKATPISEGLFNALPNAGPWRLPDIARFGEPNTVGLPPNLVIGAVFKALTEDGEQHFVVLPDGVARINGTTAAALRATNSFGLISPPSVEASVVARIAEQVFASPLPDEPLEILLREDAPTLCWAWQREPGDQAPKITVITGRHLPIAPSAMNTGIDQIGGDATVYIDGGQVHPAAVAGSALRREPLLHRSAGRALRAARRGDGNTLGLTAPLTAPWQVVSLLVDGPVLSKQAALIEHDTLPADPNPRKIDDDSSAQPVTANTGGGG